jgi:hypothetical protein
VVASEQLTIAGQDEGSGYEVVELWEGHLHFDHIFCQIVLSRESVHAGKVVDFLVQLHLAEHFNRDGSIDPLEIPIPIIFFNHNMEVKIPADLFDYLILCIDEVGSDRFVFAFTALFSVFDIG